MFLRWRSRLKKILSTASSLSVAASRYDIPKLWLSAFSFIFQHKCYIVATNDKDLKRRIRKIPGVPIMYVAQHRSVLFIYYIDYLL